MPTLSDADIARLIGVLDRRIEEVECERRELQSLCSHAARECGYEVEPGDREGLSGEYVVRCLNCGAVLP